MQKLDPQVEAVYRLCSELTHDIAHLKDKEWLVPALVSHVSHLLGRTDEETIKKRVYAWWQKVVSKAQ